MPFNEGVVLYTQKDLPVANGDPTRGVQDAYTHFLQKRFGDGPVESLYSLVDRARPFLGTLSPKHWGLDLGSAQGTFRQRYGKPNFRLVQLDFANIAVANLAEGTNRHLQASGIEIPLQDNTLATVVSNLALDFFYPREKALSELHRVLAPGAPAFLNLNSRGLMIPEDLDDKIARNMLKIQRRSRYGARPILSDLIERKALMSKLCFRENGTFFGVEEQAQIATSFIDAGFYITRLQLRSNNNGKSWWEVDLQKPYYRNRGRR